MRMSQQQFEQRLVRDGVQLEISAGAFDGSRMIGFYMNASGAWLGQQTAYDAGTGVVPDSRRQGVATELFDFMAPRLKQVAFTQYLLEVLSNNHSAVALYKRLGFNNTRQLAVFRRPEPLPFTQDGSIRRIDEIDWELFKSFWDGYPSWQNSIDAAKRIAAERIVAGAYVAERCVGYGIAFKPAASLMQLAVAPAFRRRGIGSRILSALQREVSATESLKVNNVDKELKGTLAFFEANGFKMVLEQEEMLKSLEDQTG